MTYNITKTNGDLYISLGDAEIDQSSGLSLVGKNYSNYGQLIANNFIRMLENQAHDENHPPTAPLEGQLWWDTTNKKMNFYNGTKFTSMTARTVSATEPTSPNDGDDWFDTTDGQLKTYNSGAWLLVGPGYSVSDGETGAITETLADDTTTEHVVSAIKVGGTTIGYFSSDAEYTLGAATIGLTTIKPGLNLGTTVSIVGTIDNTLSLGGYAAADYPRLSAATNTFAGHITMASNKNLTVGGLVLKTDGSNNKQVSVTSGDLTISTAGASISISNAGVIEISAGPTTANGVANRSYVDNAITGFAQSVTTNLVPYATNQVDLGSSSKRYRKMYGVSTAMDLADLAEIYDGDCEYEPGTVVSFGGDAEVTLTRLYGDTKVAGVVSTAPAYVMNDGVEHIHPVVVALVGKVPCKVIGPVKKGQLLVSSDIDGVAVVCKGQPAIGSVIGKVMENNSEPGVKLVDVAVGRF